MVEDASEYQDLTYFTMIVQHRSNNMSALDYSMYINMFFSVTFAIVNRVYTKIYLLKLFNASAINNEPNLHRKRHICTKRNNSLKYSMQHINCLVKLDCG